MVKVSKTRNKKRREEPAEIPLDYMEEGTFQEPSNTFLDYCILLYGESAIGKTSVIAQIPGCYILQCDPNRKSLRVRQSAIKNMTLSELKRERPDFSPWQIACATLQKALEDDSVRCIAIDNIGLLYEHCFNHVCWKLGIKDPNEQNDFGQTWREISDLFSDTLNTILYNEKGLVLVSHNTVKEVKEADDSTYERIEPAVQKGAFKWMKECTNYAFFMQYYNDQRVFTVRNTKEIWTKCSVDQDSPHFFDPEGNPVKRISMGASPQEGWSNLISAFDNELFDVDHVAETAEKPALKKKKKKVS
jgi:hypothetical protein